VRDVPRQAAERVLLVIAHPDDAEFWAGGTIARWTDAGTEVTYCVLSDGEAGGFDPVVPRSQPSVAIVYSGQPVGMAHWRSALAARRPRRVASWGCPARGPGGRSVGWPCGLRLGAG
jgi:LmbE family N-acetylglucosaminyl deacetylase